MPHSKNREHRSKKVPLSPETLKRIRREQDRLYPDFPKEQEYDIIIMDPPWKYEKHTQPTNIPLYETLSFGELKLLPVRRIAKENSILLMWATGPMLDKAITLIKSYGFRYVTVFQNWVKMNNGKLARIKSGYSYAQTEFLLWADKGRTNHLKTPDIVDQVIFQEIKAHSCKPSLDLFPRLMQKLHLNNCKCIEIFAREKTMKYFDVYGNELQPVFQSYLNNVIDSQHQENQEEQEIPNQSVRQSLGDQIDQMPLKTSQTLSSDERISKILEKVQCGSEINRLTDILKQYQFSVALSKAELGKTNVDTHKIRMKPDSEPKRLRPYRLSPLEAAYLDKEIDTLLELGCIERYETTWAMPVIMVKKANTTDLRMCIDFRVLNDSMIVENYPIPRIDEILTMLSRGKVFSKLDLKSGFWQILIDLDSLQYTGFITPRGTFRWKRMPFGLKNAPATFQRVMEQVLRDFLGKFCMVYIDDILVFSETPEDHEQHLRLILEALTKANLKLGADKCDFFQTQIDILGHHISNNTITPQDYKTDAIRKIPVPLNRSQVRSFVGICSYYRSFIDNFSQKCAPLHRLTRQTEPFIWTDECQRSFLQMKDELCSKPVLSIPLPNGTYVLQTDFSEKGLGAVLNQLIPGESRLRVIEYASRSLSSAEINYPAYEGEVLAVHWALAKFRHYIHGHDFILYTDNKALSQVLQNRSQSKKIIRWIMDMQEYSFTTVHRTGSENANADALSRLLPITKETLFFKGPYHISSITLSHLRTVFKFDAEEDIDEINYTYLTEGVGDIPCAICSKTHIKDIMLICDCCGLGYHGTCITPKILSVPDDAFYCSKCLEKNSLVQYKDITMDFQCLDFLKGQLDISKLDDKTLASIRKRASYYKYMHNRIFRLTHSGYLLVPTIAERRLLLLEQHRLLQHPSIQRLQAILMQNFWWSNMPQLIEEITYDCQICQARKVANYPSNHYIPTNKGHEPFHTVSMDLAPELVETERGNRHLLVIVDNFSKFTLLIPVPKKSSAIISDAAFNNLVCLFGKPKIIRVDQGSEFKGEFSQMAHMWSIQMQVATTYHPQANGLAEKQIDVVKRALTAAINDPDQPLYWDEACYPVQMSINAAKSRATGLSPFQVVFGRQMDVPQSIIYGLPLEQFQEPTPTEVQEYHQKLIKFLQTFKDSASLARDKTDSTNKKVYEQKNIKAPYQFQKNQLVFVKRANASRWSLPNIGPFIFLEFTSKTKKVAKLKNPASGVISRQSVDNLSPWKVIENIDDNIDSEMGRTSKKSTTSTKPSRRELPSHQDGPDSLQVSIPIQQVSTPTISRRQSSTPLLEAPSNVVAQLLPSVNPLPPQQITQAQSQGYPLQSTGIDTLPSVIVLPLPTQGITSGAPPEVSLSHSALRSASLVTQARNITLHQGSVELRDDPMDDVSGQNPLSPPSTVFRQPDLIQIPGSIPTIPGLTTDQDFPTTQRSQGSTEQSMAVSETQVQDLIASMLSVLPDIPSADPEDILVYSEMFNSDINLSTLPLPVQLRFKIEKTKFMSALNKRRKTIQSQQTGPSSAEPVIITVSETTQPKQTQQMDVDKPTAPSSKSSTPLSKMVGSSVRYDCLSQYQSAMNNRDIMRQQGLLEKEALKQIESYIRQYSISKPCLPKQSYSTSFVRSSNIVRLGLSQEQIAVLQGQIVPTEQVTGKQKTRLSSAKPAMRLPTLNPDFHLPATIFMVQPNPLPFADFVGSHVASAQSLPANKDRSLNTLEAAFAFDQGCRWICLQMDPKNNSYFDECIGFYLANEVWPQDCTNTKDIARVTGFRCGHTLAHDGKHWMFFCAQKRTLELVYTRLLRKMSPILMQGDSCLILVSPKSDIPQVVQRLPPPQQYEALIPIVNVWSTLTQNHLNAAFVEKFTPCLFVGGCYLPMFAGLDHAVHGEAILRMPTFAHLRTATPSINSENYYRWDTLRGQWFLVPSEQISQLLHFPTYTTESIPEGRTRTFGSWSFHTCWQRHNTLQVVPQTHTYYGPVNKGMDPRNPVLSDVPFIDQVMMGNIYYESKEAKQQALLPLIQQECALRIEWRLRFRGLDTLLCPPSSPYISYNPTGSLVNIFDAKYAHQQIPGVYEIYHRDFTQSQLAYFRNKQTNYKQLSSIPKAIAANYLPASDSYNPHVDQVIQRRFDELSERKFRQIQRAKGLPVPDEPSTLPHTVQVSYARLVPEVVKLAKSKPVNKPKQPPLPQQKRKKR